MENQEIISLLKSLEFQISKLENRILNMENKIQNLENKLCSSYKFPKPIIFPNSPVFGYTYGTDISYLS